MTIPMHTDLPTNVRRGARYTRLAGFVLVLSLAHSQPGAVAAGNQDAADGFGGVFLIAAVKDNRLEAVRHMIKDGADVNVHVPGEGTPLIAACRRGNLDLVNELLRLGADVNQPARGDGNPLIAASIKGDLTVVQRLLDAGADVNAAVMTDETALINASRASRLEVVKYLVGRGADVALGVAADNGQWRSPLNQARDQAIREFLIARGATR